MTGDTHLIRRMAAALSLVAVALVFTVGGADDEGPEMYLGEGSPGLVPVIFKPGDVSGDGIEIALALHPDGTEMYLTRIVSGKARLLASKVVDGAWTAFEPASFSSVYDDAGAFVTPDGRTLYFMSKRPGSGYDRPRDVYHLWMASRTEGGWSDADELILPLESLSGETSPSATHDGTLYYCADYPDLGGEGFYCTRFLEGGWQIPVRVDMAFGDDSVVSVEPFISPDGAFLLFYSAGRADNLAPSTRLGDLYISFRLDDGSWSEPHNLGSTINSTAEESSPSLTADAQFLFFASNRAARNRLPDIYWVSAEFLAALQPAP